MNMKNCWAMNAMTYWLYSKLAWNPNEDVDALIKEFCDKCYGEASDEMQEYYDLLELGWQNGAELIPYDFNARIMLHFDQAWYHNYFMDFDLEDGTYYLDAVYEVLKRAYEAADDTHLQS